MARRRPHGYHVAIGSIAPSREGLPQRPAARSTHRPLAQAASAPIRARRIDKGKPGVSRGRKATGLVPHPSQSAGLPNYALLSGTARRREPRRRSRSMVKRIHLPLRPWRSPRRRSSPCSSSASSPARRSPASRRAAAAGRRQAVRWDGPISGPILVASSDARSATATRSASTFPRRPATRAVGQAAVLPGSDTVPSRRRGLLRCAPSTDGVFGLYFGHVERWRRPTARPKLTKSDGSVLASTTFHVSD